MWLMYLSNSLKPFLRFFFVFVFCCLFHEFRRFLCFSVPNLFRLFVALYIFFFFIVLNLIFFIFLNCSMCKNRITWLRASIHLSIDIDVNLLLCILKMWNAKLFVQIHFLLFVYFFMFGKEKIEKTKTAQPLTHPKTSSFTYVKHTHTQNDRLFFNPILNKQSGPLLIKLWRCDEIHDV